MKPARCPHPEPRALARAMPGWLGVSADFVNSRRLKS